MNFYKILSEDENHYGLQYKTGLNVDPVPFRKKGSYVRGGIYFAREDILAFLDHGPWIRKVTIPADARWVKDPGESPEKCRANKVILGERQRITPSVIKRLIREGADVHADEDYALRWASENNHSEVIELLKSYRR